ncbi:restriction endonuclease [Paenibacillus sp. CAA11]|uniref:restriction endonuclease n=1 Tax=Paenibacillus sp. CAA11 TaxID=1532905 RepID=UPI0026BE752D
MNNTTSMIAEQPLWVYIIAAVAAIIILILVAKAINRRLARIRRRQLDPSRITIQDIDEMEGSEFEMYLYRFFDELGYEEVYKTKASSDFGADLVFTARDGIRTVLQAKRYQEDSGIGLSAVQEVYASMRYYEAGRSIVLTSARFTPACVTLAGVNGVKLLDRGDLIELIADFKSGCYEEAMDRIEREAELIPSPWKEAAVPARRTLKRARR